MNTNKGAVSGLSPWFVTGQVLALKVSQNTLGVALHRDQRGKHGFKKNYFKKQWEQNTELSI